MLDTFPVNSYPHLPLETLPSLTSVPYSGIETDSLNHLPLALNSGAEVAYFNQRIQAAIPQSQLTSNTSARLVVDPGNTLNTATSINVGTTPITLSDSLSSTDPTDYYRFSIANGGNFRLVLNGLSSNADVQLLNSNGGLIAGSYNSNKTADRITQQLNAGDYYIQIYGTNTTNYNLTVGLDYAGDSLTGARVINVGSTAGTFSDWVGSSGNIPDTNDYYRFTLDNTKNFNLALNGLTGNADVQLLNNSNGTIIASSANTGTTAEAITRQLAAGTYSIRVYPRNSNSSYNLTVSATAVAPLDNAGNTLATARVITVGSTGSTFSDWVGSLDTDDYYRFTLNNASNFNLTLNGLSSNGDVQLLDNSGVVLTTAANTGTTADSIAQQLSNGDYYIRVYPNGGDTNYSLTVSAVDVGLGTDPGNTLATAEVLSSSIFSRNEQVSSQDTFDYYRFNISQSGVFTANLTGLSGDADVRLVQDTNNNGAVDQGEILAWQWERGTTSESIRSFLNSGNYFLAVNSFNNQTATYTVGTNFTAASSDSKDFRIQVNFSGDLTAINASVLDGVQQAARFWENVISYSTFSSIHTLNINVTGQYQQANWLASAGPTSWATDLNNRLLTTGGATTINTYYASYYNNNPNYLRDVMIHELGHILGIGTLWETGGNSLINRTTATYNANTYAGQAYGELLRTYTPTAIPLTTGVGSGSDYAHWREEVFDSELLTHQAEVAGTPMPLSQMSIAALRDLGWQVNYGAAQPYTLPG